LGGLIRNEPRIAGDLAKLEAELCTRFAESGCTARPAAFCDSGKEFAARCRDHECRLHLRGCDPGCSEQSDGQCRGAAACEGCPSVLEDGDGLPCARLGQTCMISKSCAPVLSCVEISGELRWELLFPLC